MVDNHYSDHRHQMKHNMDHELKVENRREREQGFLMLSDYKLQTRVINCDVHKGRLEHVSRFWHQEHIPFLRKSCVYGKNFNRKNLVNLAKEGTLAHQSPMNIIELSIFMSHYACWKDFLLTDADLLMVAEDDAEPRSRFKHHLSQILTAITEENKPWNGLFLYYGNYLAYETEPVEIVSKRPFLQLETVVSSGIPTASAYILTRSFVEFIVKVSMPMRVPVDVVLGENFNAMGKITYTLNHTGSWNGKHGRRSPLVKVPGWTYDQSTRSIQLPPISEVMKKK